MIKPPHPGEIIKEDYLLPLGMSVSRLAAALGIGTARLNEIVLGKRGITADTALRLARHFGTSVEFWLNLQSLYDLRNGRTQSWRKNRAHCNAAQGRVRPICVRQNYRLNPEEHPKQRRTAASPRMRKRRLSDQAAGAGVRTYLRSGRAIWVSGCRANAWVSN